MSWFARKKTPEQIRFEEAVVNQKRIQDETTQFICDALNKKWQALYGESGPFRLGMSITEFHVRSMIVLNAEIDNLKNTIKPAKGLKILKVKPLSAEEMMDMVAKDVDRDL